MSKPIHPIRRLARRLDASWDEAGFDPERVIARHVRPLIRELERGARDYYPGGPAYREALKLIAKWKAKP